MSDYDDADFESDPEDEMEQSAPLSAAAAPRQKVGKRARQTRTQLKKAASTYRASPATSAYGGSPMRESSGHDPRVMSANLRQVTKIKNLLAVKDTQLKAANSEIRTLKDMQRRQERELSKVTGDGSELPRALNRKNEELRVLDARYRKVKGKVLDLEAEKKKNDKRMLRLEDKLRKAEALVKDGGLRDASKLGDENAKLKSDLADRDATVVRMEKLLQLSNKEMHRRPLKTNSTANRGSTAEVLELHSKIDKLKRQLADAKSGRVSNTPRPPATPNKSETTSRPRGRPPVPQQVTTKAAQLVAKPAKSEEQVRQEREATEATRAEAEAEAEATRASDEAAAEAQRVADAEREMEEAKVRAQQEAEQAKLAAEQAAKEQVERAQRDEAERKAKAEAEVKAIKLAKAKAEEETVQKAIAEAKAAEVRRKKDALLAKLNGTAAPPLPVAAAAGPAVRRAQPAPSNEVAGDVDEIDDIADIADDGEDDDDDTPSWLSGGGKDAAPKAAATPAKRTTAAAPAPWLTSQPTAIPTATKPVQGGRSALPAVGSSGLSSGPGTPVASATTGRRQAAGAANEPIQRGGVSHYERKSSASAMPWENAGTSSTSQTAAAAVNLRSSGTALPGIGGGGNGSDTKGFGGSLPVAATSSSALPVIGGGGSAKPGPALRQGRRGMGGPMAPGAASLGGFGGPRRRQGRMTANKPKPPMQWASNTDEEDLMELTVS